MIRIMTLDAGAQAGESLAGLCARIEPFRQNGIDLLCCQSIPTPFDDRDTISHMLSDTLGLTYSNFAAGGLRARSLGSGKHVGKGLALCTGNGIWVLNSGSFAIGNAGNEEIVQFALIRKNGISVLTLNLHLADSVTTQESQLRELFSHALLKESYGAVVLCADKAAVLSGKRLQGILARSLYHCQYALSCPDEGGLLCLLTVRNGAPASVLVHHPDPAPFADAQGSAVLPGLALELEIQRIASDKRNRFCFPLSFREQWLGYKEHRNFA